MGARLPPRAVGGLTVGTQAVGSGVVDLGRHRDGCRTGIEQGLAGRSAGVRLWAGLERCVRSGVLRRPLPGVELLEHALRDALQHLLREDAQQLPAQIQGLEHGAVLVGA